MTFMLRSLGFLLLLFASAQAIFPFNFFPGFGSNGGFPGYRTLPGQEQQKRSEFMEAESLGEWETVSMNSGVSAMHMQLIPNNKVIMFDATSLGKSDLRLPPGVTCRKIKKTGGLDCYAHSAEFDIDTAEVRPLKVITDPWCSSGGLAPDGNLVGTGGWADGGRTLRYMEGCDTCGWRESNIQLSDARWYSTQVLLPDGRFIVIGGRRAFSYEFIAPEGIPSSGAIDLPFLVETTDVHENNLYPFVHLAPDGNLFILANYKAILLDVKNNMVVRNYPDLPGGARNYPGSGSSAILPIKLQDPNPDPEVLVCGGGQPLAFGLAEKGGVFLPALDSCGRIRIMQPDAGWEIEKMPSPRIMGDMLNLPNGEILIINGAKKGASGWQFADDPNLTPVIYDPYKPAGERFKELNPGQIPRMYHSSSAVLPDGKILVAGSNTNPGYRFTDVKFPTELRVEKFSPPYLDPELDSYRPAIDPFLAPKIAGYGQPIVITFHLNQNVVQEDIIVTLYQPPFTTHGYSMNQRLLDLAVTSLLPGIGSWLVVANAPAKAALAPPGYYLLFVNYRGVPSVGSWIHLL